MRAHALLLAVAALVASRSKIPPPVDTPVRLSEGGAVDVPFAVSATGTFDVQLQYPNDQIPQHFKEKSLDGLAGRATLRAVDKKLEWQLPTGWFRLSPFDSSAFGTVLVRFHAYAGTPYVLTLQVTRLPDELKNLEGWSASTKSVPVFIPDIIYLSYNRSNQSMKPTAGRCAASTK